jgi:hypothetical protein
VRYRRPSLKTLALAAVVATAGSALFAFSRPVEMTVDGRRVPSDVPPVSTIGERVYVPLRSVADALGAQTDLDGENNIYVVRGNQSLRVRVGDMHASVNGMPFTLRHVPFRVRGRVMIGLKEIAHAFGVHVSYNARTAQVQMMTPGIGETQPSQTPQAQ